MGWFNKKEDAAVPAKTENSLPQLPELPELPELPSLHDSVKHDDFDSIHKLPKFPSTPFGEKFSQNTIKQAVKGLPHPRDYLSGEDKGDRVFEADEFEPISTARMMPKTQKKIPPSPFVKRREEFDAVDREDEYEESSGSRGGAREEGEDEPELKALPKKFTAPTMSILDKKEPVYIRLDKFESGMKTFEKTKKQIFDIEKTLENVSKVREEEGKQLEIWKNEILKVKEQINRVDQDIFSKVE